MTHNVVYAQTAFPRTHKKLRPITARSPAATPSVTAEPVACKHARERKAPRMRAVTAMILWSREMTSLRNLKRFGSAISSHQTVVSTTTPAVSDKTDD
jgi:hypothetical protein